MSTPALILLVLVVAQLLRVLIGRRGFHRLHLFNCLQGLDRWSWPATVTVGCWQVWHDGVLVAMVPVHLLAALVLAAAIVGRRRQARGGTSGRRGVLARAALVVVSLPLVALPLIEATVVPIDVDDFRDESWTSAFDRLHATLRSHYAFADWKRVDWDRLHTDHAPAVAAAQRSGDALAYHRAVRAYLFAIPDGHLGIDGPAHDQVRFAEIGGGFGLSVVRLDDGTVIANVLDPKGPAAEAGMAWGARIIEWDGSPVDTAVAATPTLWASRPPATIQTATIAQHQLLIRAPVGEVRLVTFRNPGERRNRTAALVARDDGYASLHAAIHGGMPVSSSGRGVGYGGVPGGSSGRGQQMLGDGIGYVRIASLETVDGLGPVAAMDRAMRALGPAGGEARALILDVRGNRGGWDGHVPKMMSYFTPHRLLYERIAVPALIGSGTLGLFSLHVEPNELQFTGPVVVLVDHRTKSSGEGFALIAKKLPNVQVVGMSATDGSFGMAGGSLLLPTGIEVVYPVALSTDGDGIVQVDGDHRLRGGVQPDVRVPLTLETAESIYRHGNDAVLEFARRRMLEPDA